MHRKGYSSINIFEMGLGTGLNAYLSLLEGHDLGININYQAVETDPIDPIQAQSLNYTEQVSNSSNINLQSLHDCKWNESIELHPKFSFEKHHTSLQEFNFDKSLDLIYFDAFAPSSQPELWEEDIHKKIYDALSPGGVLVTYCAKGSFKRMLKSLGYTLENLNGPNKKREMVRVTKP
jgi:tRNA U34 5-methylaminomethyl-2-thiouridine-forming methyltransferase MnmC